MNVHSCSTVYNCRCMNTVTEHCASLGDVHTPPTGSLKSKPSCKYT